MSRTNEIDGVATAQIVLTSIIALFVLFAAGYVLRHWRRQALRVMRLLISLLLLCWVLGTFGANHALRNVSGSGYQTRIEQRDFLCQVYIVVSLGFVEPCLLAMIGGIFYYKSQDGAVTSWRPLRLLLIAFGLALLVVVVQACLLILADTGAVAPEILGPQPADLANTTSYTGWWRYQGCAGSYGTLAVNTLVFLCFEIVWVRACQRLIQSIVNIRMRWRLRCMQLTFTMVPLLLLVPRAMLVFLPATWHLTRQLLKTAEIAVTLAATVVAVIFLILRPVIEDGEDRADRLQPGGSASINLLATHMDMGSVNGSPMVALRVSTQMGAANSRASRATIGATVAATARAV